MEQGVQRLFERCQSYGLKFDGGEYLQFEIYVRIFSTGLQSVPYHMTITYSQFVHFLVFQNSHRKFGSAFTNLSLSFQQHRSACKLRSVICGRFLIQFDHCYYCVHRFSTVNRSYHTYWENVRRNWTVVWRTGEISSLNVSLFLWDGLYLCFCSSLQPRADLSHLMEGLQEYTGILSTFPEIIHVHKVSSAFVAVKRFLSRRLACLIFNLLSYSQPWKK